MVVGLRGPTSSLPSRQNDCKCTKRLSAKEIRMRLLVSVVLLASSVFAAERNKTNQRLDDAATVFSEIMVAPDKGIPHDLLEKAHCRSRPRAVGRVCATSLARFLHGQNDGRTCMDRRGGDRHRCGWNFGVHPRAPRLPHRSGRVVACGVRGGVSPINAGSVARADRAGLITAGDEMPSTAIEVG